MKSYSKTATVLIFVMLLTSVLVYGNADISAKSGSIPNAEQRLADLNSTISTLRGQLSSLENRVKVLEQRQLSGSSSIGQDYYPRNLEARVRELERQLTPRLIPVEK